MVTTGDHKTLATKTLFGWSIEGAIPNNNVQTPVPKVSITDERADDILQRFWDMEDVPGDHSSMTAEELLPMTNFTDNYFRDDSGRSRVTLPVTLLCLSLVNRVLQHLSDFTKMNVLLSTRTNGSASAWHWKNIFNHHSERVPASELNKSPSMVYYLPMHGVLKDSSSTTKLRIVFDASANTSSGILFNQQLLPGPSLYPLLTSVINCFRRHFIAMTSDVSKMFREILLHPDEKYYHRFLVRNSQGNIQDWRMLRLTFGVSSSPFLATRVLCQLAKDIKEDYPTASSIILSSFYVCPRSKGWIWRLPQQQP